jgi:uncharacterized membrane protein (DUF2068 family)
MRTNNSGAILRSIAVYKFFKALVVVGAGLGLLNLLHPLFTAKLYGFVESLPQVFAPELLRQALDFLTSLSPIKIRWFSFASFSYAALFLTEGVGLWAGWQWAEWLTVIMTASFIPIEIYEVVRFAHWLRVAILFGNIGVLIYLVMLIKSQRADRESTHNPT